MKTFIRPPLTYRIIFILSFLITAPAYSQFENISITNHPDDQSETHICVSPLNSNLLLATWNDWRSSSYTRPGYAFSTDGGLTWPTQGIVTPPEYTYGIDPSGGFDRFGNVFYCYMTPVPECGASNHGPIFVSKTTNLGNSWSHTQVSYICSDKPLMTIDNTGGFYDGRIYVTYTQFHSGGSRVKFAYSTNNGMSFSQEVTLGAEFGTNRCSMPAVGPSGEIYVCWRNDNYGVNACSLFVYKSTNGGQSFIDLPAAASFTLRNNFEVCGKLWGPIDPHLPNISIDPLNSNVYIVYTAAEYLVDSDLRIWWIRSTNGGITFSNPQIISSSVGGKHQFFGTMSVNSNYRISVFFETLSSSSKRNYFVTESFNDGLSFRQPVKINEQEASCSGKDHHYQWIASINDCTFPCWTTLVSLTGEVFTAKGVTVSLSDNSSATLSGSVRKSVYKQPNTSWNNVFISNNSLLYHYSKNNGKSWSCAEKISGSAVLNSTSNPSLSLYNNEFHAVYKNNASGIYYNRTQSGIWGQPFLLENVESNVTGIASTIDGSETGHVSYSYLNGSVYYLKHGTFSTSDQYPILSNLTQVTSSANVINSPSISCDNSGIPHVSWHHGEEIYYSLKQAGRWSTPFNVSSSQSSSESPCIGIGSDNKVHIAWQEDVSGAFDIYYRSRTSGGAWGNVSNISNNSGNSIQPHMEVTAVNQPFFVWSEGGMNSPYDIKYSYPVYYQSGTVEATQLDSRYPTFTQRNDNVDPRMLILWTDGPVNNYLIENNYVDLIPQDLPYQENVVDSGWVILNSGTFNHLRSVFFVNDLIGFTTGGFLVLKTINSGLNWSPYIDTNLINGGTSIFFPNLNTGYLGTEANFLKTTNQGQNWFSLGNVIEHTKSLFFINTVTGFVTANQGQFAIIATTSNGGVNFIYQGTGSLSPGEVFFPSPSTGYAAFSSNIMKTTNAGINWIIKNGVPGGFNRGLHFVNIDTGYVSTLPGNLFKTTNGGTNWQLLNSGTTSMLVDVLFVNKDTGYCVGDSSIILKTTNGGINWQHQFSGITPRLIRQIFFTSVNTGYIVGDSGLILKTTTGGEPIGINPVSNIVPDNYKLYQNYPNPFNPTTKIKFELPHTLNAKVEVYDALGRLVDVLLNRRLTAGVYEISWDGTSFASGIYYVRLSAGNFTDVKKIVLLK